MNNAYVYFLKRTPKTTRHPTTFHRHTHPIAQRNDPPPTLLQTASDCANFNEETACEFTTVEDHFSLFDKRGADVMILMDLQSLRGSLSLD